MKIAFFADTFYPYVDGVTTTVMNYSHGLAELGHKVMIVVPSYPDVPTTETSPKIKEPKLFFHKNVTIERLPSVDLKMMPELRIGVPVPKIFKNIAEFDPDIIHTHTPVTIGWWGLHLAGVLKKPVVTTHHTHFTDRESLKFLHLYHSDLAHKAQSGLKVFLKRFLNQHELIFVPSQDVWDDLHSYHFEKKMRLLPNPVLASELMAAKKKGLQLRKQLNIKESIIYVGRLSGEKSIDLVIQVFAKLVEHRPELKLVLIGDGRERESLFSLASKLGVNKSIIWTGSIPHQQLIDDGYYFLGDVFMTLSRFETQGLSTIEAMSCGLPIVGADAHATTELVKNTGLLISSKNPTQIAAQVEKLFSNKKMMTQFRKNSQKTAQKFSLEVLTKRLLEFYESVL